MYKYTLKIIQQNGEWGNDSKNLLPLKMELGLYGIEIVHGK